MNSIINKVFIPPIADIIRDYYYPDYKRNYDAVVSDIGNWVAGDAVVTHGDDERDYPEFSPSPFQIRYLTDVLRRTKPSPEDEDPDEPSDSDDDEDWGETPSSHIWTWYVRKSYD